MQQMIFHYYKANTNTFQYSYFKYSDMFDNLFPRIDSLEVLFMFSWFVFSSLVFKDSEDLIVFHNMEIITK